MCCTLVARARPCIAGYIAKRWGGKFVLRIEDTDLERSTPESVQAILDSMEWLGLDFDEGPYFQTERFDRHLEVIGQLVEQGNLPFDVLLGNSFLRHTTIQQAGSVLEIETRF